MPSFKTKRAQMSMAGARVDVDLYHWVGIKRSRSWVVALRFSLAASVLALAAVLLWSAPAMAKEVHVYKSTFGSEGSGPGQLDGPVGIAVDDATHDVYVVDRQNNRVERFSSTGEYEGQFNGSGNYEDLEEAIPVKTGAAPLTGAFSNPATIAVDNSTSLGDPSKGDVYVADQGHGVVDKFTAAGAYLGQLTGTPNGSFTPDEALPRYLGGVAVDRAGDLWVGMAGEFASFGNALENQFLTEFSKPFGGTYGDFGVDPEDDLYFNASGTVIKVSSSGETLLGSTNAYGEFFRPFGGENDRYPTANQQSAVAVDASTGEVFIGRHDTSEPYEPSVGAFGLDGAPIERFGLGRIPEGYDPFGGIAVDGRDGTVYVSDLEANNVEVFEGITLPEVSVAAPSAQSPRAVTLNGSVNPEGKPIKSCVFEYDTREYQEGEAAHGVSVPCSPSAGVLGEGTTEESVSARVEGLVPETQYYYRLVAQNAAPEPDQSASEGFFAGPKFGGEFVTNVASGSATVQDSIDPDGGATEYRLEYGTSIAYEHFASGNVGAGVSVVPVSVHLQELQAGTVYHYRLVAMQDGEVFSGPDRTFTTQSAAGKSVLPDGRVWELVSPPDKDGALIEPFELGGQIQAASDGSGITYQTAGPAVGEDPVGDTERSQVLSRRGADGWSTVDLTLPGRLPEDGEAAEALYNYKAEYQLFSPDLSFAAVEPKPAGTPLLSAEATERTLYLRNDLTASFLPLVTPSNLPDGVKIEEESAESGGIQERFEMHFVAATPDLSHIVLKTPAALTPEAIDEETIDHHEPLGNIQQNFYEWNDGQLQLINILPDGQEAHGPFDKSPFVEFAGTSDGSAGGYGGAQRAISNDGRRIAWTWGEYNIRYKGLYVRDMVEEKTVKVGGGGAIYQTMNSEGSEIFYLEGGELYVYDFETETASDLTSAHGAEGSGGVQQAVSDVSEDGSYVYFVATGVLAEGGVSGADNLYLLHDTGAGWTTTYIATLAAQDSPTWYTVAFFGDGMNLSRVSSRVSPDGRYLAFMSDRPLTGYDSTDAVSGEPDEEVYLYDAQENKLVCASCDPTGARPAGIFDSKDNPLLVDTNAIWSGEGGDAAGTGEKETHWLAGSVPGYDAVNTLFTYQPRYLSNSGRLFFNSPVGLVPQDSNGLEDVYEYEPEGVGGCTSSISSAMIVYEKELAGRPVGGCVGLISSGTSGAESVFYDASENGDDVFFDTKSRLVGEDYDNSYDVYDAHVCSAEVPCKVVPVSPPPCDSGDSCKAAPSPQPAIFGAPASATFGGAGNVTPTTTAPSVVAKKITKCSKGRKLSHGKCVKRKAKRKQQAKRADNDRRAKR